MVPEQVAQEGRGLVEATGRGLGGAVGVQQLGVGGAGGVQGAGCGAEFGCGGTQQGLGLLCVGGDQLVGKLGVVVLAVGRGQALGLAAQSAELLARRGGAGLQELDQGLGSGGGRLAGRAVGAVGAFEELGGAGADLVGEPVQLGEGGALVALGAGLFGAQVGADADLLVQLGRGPVGLAQGGEGRARCVALGLRDVLGGAGDLGALGPQGAGGAAGVVGGALGGPAVLVGGAGPLQADGGAGFGLGCLLDQFAQFGLPAGAFAQPVGQACEYVGDAAGALGGLLSLVADAGGVGGGFVGLGACRAGLGEHGLGRLGGRAGGAGGFGELGEHAGRAVGAPGADAGGEGPVPGEASRERADVLVPGGGPAPERLPFLVGGVLVVHGRVRRDEEHTVRVGAGTGGRYRGEQRGGGADGHGGARQQGGAAQDFTGAGVRIRVGDDHAVDQLGTGGEHRRVVGGVDGLGEIAPARQCRDAVLAEIFDRGEDIGSGRQQSAVAERAEDAGVVGGRGAQFEEAPFRGGDALVEEVPQLVGVAVELLGGERLLAADGVVGDECVIGDGCLPVGSGGSGARTVSGSAV